MRRESLTEVSHGDDGKVSEVESSEDGETAPGQDTDSLSCIKAPEVLPTRAPGWEFSRHSVRELECASRNTKYKTRRNWQGICRLALMGWPTTTQGPPSRLRGQWISKTSTLLLWCGL